MKNRPEAPATSLVKALRVLVALEGSPEGRGVTDIARELGRPKSAVHRLLVTFQSCGFVRQQSATSRYILGPTLARLGLRAAEYCTPHEVARPFLEALAQEVGETVFLGVRDQEGMLIVDKVERGQILRIAPALGTTLPLWQTALGRIWLACCPATEQEQLLSALVARDSSVLAERQLAERRQELATIAQQGFTVSLETWMPDVCCVAAPIRNGRGALVAALALSLPRSRMPQPPRHDPFARGSPGLQYPTLVPPLLRTAQSITAALP